MACDLFQYSSVQGFVKHKAKASAVTRINKPININPRQTMPRFTCSSANQNSRLQRKTNGKKREQKRERREKK